MKKLFLVIFLLFSLITPAHHADAAKFRPYTTLTGATADSLDSEIGMSVGDTAFVITSSGTFSSWVCKASSATADGTTVIKPALLPSSTTLRWHKCGISGAASAFTSVDASTLGGHAASYFQAAGSYLTSTGDGSGLVNLSKTQVGLDNVTNVEQIPLTYLNTSDDTLSGGSSKIPSDAMVAAYVAAHSGDGGGEGATALTGLTDVTISSPTNTQALLYNSSTSKWINSSLGTGAFATIANYVPTSRTVNSKALSSNITLTYTDVGAAPETGSTSYVPMTRTINGYDLSSNRSLTYSDVGAVPTSRTVNGYALTSNISLSYGDVGAAASSHAHAGSSITSGTVGIAYGGTGVSLSDPGYNGVPGWDDTDNSISFWHLGTGLSYDHSTHTISSSASAGSTTFDLLGTGTNTSGATMTVGNTTTLTYTGTGSINASALQGYAASAFSLSGHTHSTYLAVASNLSDLNSASTARTNLGLGSMATQASNNVSITGGSATLASMDLGSASTTTGALGLYNSGSAYKTTVQPGSPGAAITLTLPATTGTLALTTGNITGSAASLSSTLSPATGGTGVSNNSSNTITFTGAYSLGLTLSGSTSVTLPTSGTLATTTSSSSSMTGYPTGAQPLDATLMAFAGQTTAAGSITYGTGADALSQLSIGSAGQIMRSSGTAPTWTTLTMPTTIAAGSVFVANSANVLSALTSTSGTYVLTNTSGTISWASASSGTIGGSTGSTDNAIIRADGTGGSTVQAGTTTLSDAGVLNLPSGGSIQINGVTMLDAGSDGAYGIQVTDNTSALAADSGKYVYGSIGGVPYFASSSASQQIARLGTAQTWTGKQSFAASASGGAGVNLGSGSAPSSPANGDIWVTTSGLYARINGSTVGPFGTGSGSGLPSGTGIVYDTSGTGSVIADLTFDGSHTISLGASGIMDLHAGKVYLGDLIDSNANELVKFSATSSAVNEITVANAATGAGPTISATGGDTNIDLNLSGKGTGVIKTARDLEITSSSYGLILQDSNGTRYRITVNTSGIVVITSL